MTEIAVNESNAYSERKYVIFLMADQPLEHFFYEEAGPRVAPLPTCVSINRIN